MLDAGKQVWVAAQRAAIKGRRLTAAESIRRGRAAGSRQQWVGGGPPVRCSNSGFVWLQHAVAVLALVPASLAALTAGAGSRIA